MMNLTMGAIRVLLVDSNILFRCGIARLLESQPDIQVVGETDECLQAIHLASTLHPDVMLLDIDLNECDGPTLTRLIKKQFPDMHLVILTTDLDPDTLLGCVLAGAEGYLHKNITPDELFDRLRGLTRGESAMALTTVGALLRRLSTSNCTLCLRATSNPNLTPRECEVLGLVARGMTNKRIAAVLRISDNTVRNHLCSVYQKLHLKNRLQVAVYSVTHGLVDLDNVS
jgi:two-component system, NarL family, nitrate/nitrite response regulator NarL